MAGLKGSTPGGSTSGAAPENRGGSRGFGRPVWDLPEPTPEEVQRLQQSFPEIASIPEALLGEECVGWAAHGVVARSLGRRVSADAMAREMRWRGGLKGEVHGSQLARGFALIRFSLAEERDRVLSRPWVAMGQTLAVEPWRPAFFPEDGAVKTALVWVRLPNLPVEYWRSEILRELLRPAGEFVAEDEWTLGRKCLGFVRVCLRISLCNPLRPGVQINGPAGVFWQRFVYEYLEGVCLDCARFHEAGGCRLGTGVPVPEGSGCPSAPKQGVPASEPTVFGPWLLAVRRWQPSPAASASAVHQGKSSAPHRSAVVPGRTMGKEATAVVPGRRSGKEISAVVPGRRPGKEAVGEEDGGRDGWSQPSKVARRSFPRRADGVDGRGRSVRGGRWAALVVDGVARGPEQGEGELDRDIPSSGKGLSLTSGGEELARDGSQALVAGLRPTREAMLLGDSLGLSTGRMYGESHSHAKRARSRDREAGRGPPTGGVKGRACPEPVDGRRRKIKLPDPGSGTTFSLISGPAAQPDSLPFTFSAGSSPDLANPLAISVPSSEQRAKDLPMVEGSSEPMKMDHEEAVRKLVEVFHGPAVPSPSGGGAPDGQTMEECSGKGGGGTPSSPADLSQ